MIGVRVMWLCLFGVWIGLGMYFGFYRSKRLSEGDQEDDTNCFSDTLFLTTCFVKLVACLCSHPLKGLFLLLAEIVLQGKKGELEKKKKSESFQVHRVML